jgi:hypothetical protein
MNELVAALNAAFAGTLYAVEEDYGELLFSHLDEPIDFGELPEELQHAANELLAGPFIHLHHA